MKRFIPALLTAVLLFTGCSAPDAAPNPAGSTDSGSQASLSATPSAQPTKAPVFLPALARELAPIEYEEEPINQYYQSDLSPEEKVTQLRIYEVVAEHLNADSPIHETPDEVGKALADKGHVTRHYLDRYASMDEFTPAQQDRRRAGFSHQVTGIYCPMRAQTLVALEDGKAACFYTGRVIADGSTVGEGTWLDATGLVYDDPADIEMVSVYLKNEGGYYKVDGMTFTGSIKAGT